MTLNVPVVEDNNGAADEAIREFTDAGHAGVGFVGHELSRVRNGSQRRRNEVTFGPPRGYTDRPTLDSMTCSTEPTLTADVDTLSDSQCRHLLGTRTLGRVGVTSGGLPHIVPVCYLYDGSAIVFRTGPGTKLRAAASGDVLAFEVDHFDPASGQGWSVMVLGRASILTTEHENEGLPSLDSPSGVGERNHYVRLHCELVSGRAIDTALRS